MDDKEKELRIKELKRTVNKLKRKLHDTKKYGGEQRQVFADQIKEAEAELKKLNHEDIKLVANTNANIIANHVERRQSKLMNNKFLL